jgi:rare lipoprotein A
MTAAHRTLPFGTKVRVTNLWNGRSEVIRINDRGPFVHHRVIDLGHGAANSLGLTASGIAQVRLEVLR